MASAAIRDFFRHLKLSGLKGIDRELLEGFLSKMKNLSVNLPSGIREIFQNIETSFDDSLKQLVTAEGVPIETISKLARSGNLEELVKTLKLNINVTGDMKKGFENLVKGEFPEHAIALREENFNKVRSGNGGLDIIPGKTVQETAAALGPKNVEKIKNIAGKVKTALGVGAVAAGIYAAWYLTDDVLKTLHEAALASSGCFKLQTSLGTTTSCRLTGRTCLDTAVNGATPCESDPYPYNYMALVADRIYKNQDMADIFGSADAITGVEGASAALLDTNKLNFLIDYFAKNVDTLKDLSICVDDPLFEPKMSRCRACDTAAAASSILYLFDDDSVADNITFKCKPPSSILETLVDVTSDMGGDFFNNLFGFDLATLVKYGLVFVVLILIIMVVSKLLPQRQAQIAVQQAPPPPTQAPPQFGWNPSLSAPS